MESKMINIIKTTKLTVRGSLLFVCFLGGISIFSLAMNSTNYTLDWDVINSGGDEGSSTNYRINVSVAQAAIDSAASTSYQLEAGYWSGLAGEEAISYQTDNQIK
ncbi:hypothetical protein KAI68_06405, partial [bacterium]|nr:hypothetical protein [bacterium]